MRANALLFRFFGFALVIALAFTTFITPTYAASFTVDKFSADTHDANPGDGICSDGGTAPNCTLRAAIEEINALAAAALPTVNTISIGAGTVSLTIGELLISNRAIQFTGVSASTIIDGLGTTRLFHIETTPPNSFSVDFTNVIFQNGIGDNGGCLLYEDSGINASLIGVAFLNCNADNQGGAVWFNTGTLAISNSTFGNSSNPNTAGAGGAVYIDSGDLNITSGSTFRNNSAGNGGAIYAGDDVTVTADDSSIFQANVASTNGGAIYLQTDSDFFGANVGFFSNTANNGSAFYSGGGTATTRECISCCIVGNSGTAANALSSYAVVHTTNSPQANFTSSWWGSALGPGDNYENLVTQNFSYGDTVRLGAGATAGNPAGWQVNPSNYLTSAAASGVTGCPTCSQASGTGSPRVCLP